MSKKLVAYFSASGVTKKVALRLAQEELVELFEICPKIEYTSADLNWMDDNSRSSLEMKAQSCRPEILNKLDNLDQYEIIYLGFPIWWYVEPRIIDTFLESYNFSKKQIVPFATSGGSGISNVVENLKAHYPELNFADGRLLNNYID
ncbi:flavodoxin [Erysipelatoclostridium ramosum]|uniref:flavodoxin n=1 Tax=Thomasclavelia ramosa TaxID=1547 RepID=UPI0018ABEE20|nr:flavodoxin [Thomasclavelia ramosa]MDB7092972.1 flavodoxin [Thomasclavelia ramosa]